MKAASLDRRLGMVQNPERKIHLTQTHCSSIHHMRDVMVEKWLSPRLGTLWNACGPPP